MIKKQISDKKSSWLFRILLGQPVSFEWILRVTILSFVITSPVLAMTIWTNEVAEFRPFYMFGISFLATIVTLLMLKIPAFIGWIVSIPSLVYCGYIFEQKTSLSRNDALIFYQSPFQEVWDFITGEQMIAMTLLVVGGGILLAGITCSHWYASTKWTQQKLKWITVKYIFLPPVVLLIILLQMFQYVKANDNLFVFEHFPYKTYQDARIAMVEVRQPSIRYAKVDYTFQTANKLLLPEKINLILGIGESARASNWHAYGYDHPTTPNVDRRLKQRPEQMLIYRDATSAARLTMYSVPSMLSPIPVKEFEHTYDAPSISSIFNQGEYGTIVLSSRGGSSFWSKTVEMMLNDCQHIERYNQKGNPHFLFDEGIRSKIDVVMQRNPSRKLIVLNISGSHYKYSDRYPQEFDVFLPSKKTGTFTPAEKEQERQMALYDNTILYTDTVLESVMTAMDKSKIPSIFIYTSDHGENIDDSGDGNYYHSWKNYITGQEIYVPFIIYVNQVFVQLYPKKWALLNQRVLSPVSHDNISHTLLGLAGLIDPQIYRPEYDLSSETYLPNERFSLRGFNQPVSIKLIHKEVNAFDQKVGLWPKVLQKNYEKLLEFSKHHQLKQ